MFCIVGKTSSLTWSLLTSIALHSLLLWHFGLIWNRHWPSLAMAPLPVTTWLSEEGGPSPGEGAQKREKDASRQGQPAAASKASPAASGDSSAAGSGEGSPGLGNVV